MAAARREVNRLYRATVDAGVEYDPFFAGDGPQPYETHPLYLEYHAAVMVLRSAKTAYAAARFEFRPDLRARFASIVSAFDADDFDGGDF